MKGAVQRCEALGESHWRLPFVLFCRPGLRRNVYDGEIEYWVTVRETGKRKEETSMEQTHTKEEEAACGFESNCLTRQREMCNGRWRTASLALRASRHADLWRSRLPSKTRTSTSMLRPDLVQQHTHEFCARSRPDSTPSWSLS